MSSSGDIDTYTLMALARRSFSGLSCASNVPPQARINISVMTFLMMIASSFHALAWSIL